MGFDFTGKVVVIAGGSRGLGLAIAEEAGRRGATVAFCARDMDEVEWAHEKLRSYGIAAFGDICNVTIQSDADTFVARVTERFGRVDVLFNVAGVIQVGPFKEMTASDFGEALSINFLGPLHMMLAVLPDMRRRGEGRIVNVGSIGGRIGVPHLAPYCSGKFALTGFCEAVRPELRRDGIILTLVQPGLMRTGSARNAFFKGRHRLEYAWFSIADSLFAISAANAAREILNAARSGAIEAPIGFLATAGIAANRFMPRVMRTINAVADGLLPRAGGIGNDRARGYESTSPLSPSVATLPNQEAEKRYGQRV